MVKLNVKVKQNAYNNITKLLVNEENIKQATKEKKNNGRNLKLLFNNKNMQQHQAIKCGIILEKWIKNIISKFGLEVYPSDIIMLQLNVKSKKRKKQIDVCFRVGNTLYYFEIKSNINLDTEKSGMTDTKVRLIKNYLENNLTNSRMKVVAGVLTVWYDEDPSFDYKLTSDIYYMKDFFEIIGHPMSKNEYYRITHKFGELMKKCTK